jgi:predicted aspartyl protease
VSIILRIATTNDVSAVITTDITANIATNITSSVSTGAARGWRNQQFPHSVVGVAWAEVGSEVVDPLVGIALQRIQVRLDRVAAYASELDKPQHRRSILGAEQLPDAVVGVAWAEVGSEVVDPLVGIALQRIPVHLDRVAAYASELDKPQHRRPILRAEQLPGAVVGVAWAEVGSEVVDPLVGIALQRIQVRLDSVAAYASELDKGELWFHRDPSNPQPISETIDLPSNGNIAGSITHSPYSDPTKTKIFSPAVVLLPKFNPPE